MVRLKHLVGASGESGRTRGGERRDGRNIGLGDRFKGDILETCRKGDQLALTDMPLHWTHLAFDGECGSQQVLLRKRKVSSAVSKSF